MQKKATIISVFNQKGGCAKTTSAINIATALTYFPEETIGKKECKICLIDMDSQANTSYIALNMNDDEIEEKRYITIDKMMLDREYSVKNHAIATNFKNIDIVPATIDHAFTDMQCMHMIDNNRILEKRIGDAIYKYDYIIIDNPPAISICTFNSLMASDYVLAPIESSMFSVKGLRNLINLVSQINESVKDKEVKLITFLAKVDNRRKIKNHRIKKTLGRVLGDNFINTTHISMSSVYIDSLEDSQTAVTWDKKNNGKKEYIALTKAIIDKIEGR